MSSPLKLKILNIKVLFLLQTESKLLYHYNKRNNNNGVKVYIILVLCLIKNQAAKISENKISQ